jgi:hypothetical protein
MASGTAAADQAGELAACVGQGGALERHGGAGISIWGIGRLGTHR